MYPEVYVSVGKDRRRSYNGNYYLKNGEEFELELFNPESEVFTCEISLNGKPISNSTLILKPGERVFLDRYLDEEKRFKFETYEVEDSKESKQAIRLNGQVKVRFFKEKKVVIPLRRRCFNNEYDNRVYLKGITRDGWNMSPITTDVPFNEGQIMCSCAPVETGMVEKGSNSDQQLIENNSFKFESYSSYEKTFYIYPEANKPVSITEMVEYCSNCGKKRKKGDNFCSSCGKKF